MACIYINTGNETDLDNYIACLVSEVRSKVDGLNTTINASATSTRALINATTSGINGNINSSTSNIINNLFSATNNLLGRINTSETNVKGKVDNAVTTLTSNLVNASGNIIRSLGTRLDQIRSESQVLQNLTTQAINVSTANQTSTLQQIIQASENSIKAAVASSGNGIGDFIDSVTEGIRDLINDIVEALGNLFQPFIDAIQGWIDTTLFSAGKKLGDFARQIGQFSTNYAEIVRRVQEGEYDDLDRLLSDLKLTNIDLGFYRSLLDIATILPLIIQVSTSGFKAFSRQLEYLVNEEFRPTLLTPNDAIDAYIKGLMTFEQLENELSKWGYSEDKIIDLINLAKPLLNADILTRGKLRGFISENDYEARLEQLGYAQPEINLIRQLSDLLPPINDLITMSVREAFSPEIASKFGQYDDYPTDLTQYANQQGLSEKWAKAYWASHWGLPSPFQGFEMLHRGIIDRATLSNLLRALDIMPFWRDKVIDLSYNTLRLVDIRRFYQDGVIDERQMFNEYKATGYNDERAMWASNWTIQNASKGSETEQAERRLLSQAVITKAYTTGRMNREQAIDALMAVKYTREDANLILDLYDTKDNIDKEDAVIQDNLTRIKKLANDAYGNRLISRDDASEMLINAGYTQNQVTLELDTVDYEFEQKIKAHIVDWYKDLYITWEIDETDISNRLGEYGFEAGEISRLISEFSILRETRIKKPTLEQFTRWFRRGIIDESEYIRALKGLGYADHYITNFVLEVQG